MRDQSSCKTYCSTSLLFAITALYLVMKCFNCCFKPLVQFKLEFKSIHAEVQFKQINKGEKL